MKKEDIKTAVINAEQDKKRDESIVYRVKIVLFLSALSLALLIGLFVNAAAPSTKASAPATSHTVANSLLPSLSLERNFGSIGDDEFVDAYCIDGDVYVFYNTDKGFMTKNFSEAVEYNGKIEYVCPFSDGFALAIKTDGGYVLRSIDPDGSPSHSAILNLPEVRIDYFAYNGDELVICATYKGNYDTVLAVYKYSQTLERVYERVIYSPYNLSVLACYPLSNGTVVFFNAKYGSVEKTGMTVIYSVSQATDTQYFNIGEDYLGCSVVPMGEGFAFFGITKEGTLFRINVDKTGENASAREDLAENVADITAFGDGTDYFAFVKSDVNRLYKLTNTGKLGESVPYFDGADDVLDCAFSSSGALFSFVKNGKTRMFHYPTGLCGVIADSTVSKLKIVYAGGYGFFTSMDVKNTSLSSLGGADVYYAKLQ